MVAKGDLHHILIVMFTTIPLRAVRYLMPKHNLAVTFYSFLALSVSAQKTRNTNHQSNHMKTLILFLFASLFLYVEAFAEPYRVSTSNGLNVRASSNKNSEVLGKLTYDEVVDVITVNNGWASISWNGQYAYVNASYLIPMTTTDINTPEKKKSWNFFSWLFNTKGESAWFTGLKWFFILVLAVIIVRIALVVFIKMLAGGIIAGGVTLFVAFIIKWIGWIEMGTMWNISQWGFYIGSGLGLLYSIFNFGEVLEEAADTSSSSSSGSTGGLKSYSVTCDGEVYTLTQNSQYSECDYTDQHGNQWQRDSSGFHLS